MTVYLSIRGSNVSQGNGLPWTVASQPMTLQPGDSLYAIAGSGTATASVLTLGGQ